MVYESVIRHGHKLASLIHQELGDESLADLIEYTLGSENPLIFF